jgi:hypothetical protein
VTGRFLPGNQSGGRTEGTKEAFPRSAFQAMRDIIAGRLRKNEGDKEIPISEKMVQLLFDGMEGKIVLSHNQHGDVIASPAIFLKALHEYMFKMQERALRKAELEKKEKGSATGGIRVSCYPRSQRIPCCAQASRRDPCGSSARIHRNHFPGRGTLVRP